MKNSLNTLAVALLLAGGGITLKAKDSQTPEQILLKIQHLQKELPQQDSLKKRALIQEQIDTLKKQYTENILMLQKPDPLPSEVKNSQDSILPTQQELKTDTKKNPTDKASIIKTSSKSGWFIGVEGNFAQANLSEREHYESGLYDPKHNIRNVYDETTYFKSANVFRAGLSGGYQHYFGNSQMQGIKISVHIYSGYAKWSHTSNERFIDSREITTETISTSVSYIPISSGIDIKYLWDFFQMGKHSLGINVGVGYAFDYYVGDRNKGSYSVTFSAHPEKNSAESWNDPISSEYNISASNFYPVIGLHYYYGHHQFEILYRFGGLVIQKGQSKKINLENNITPYSYDIDDITLYLKSNDYLTLNYAYRF